MNILYMKSLSLAVYREMHGCFSTISLLWHHNGHYSVSNHQPHDCLLNCLFRRRSKKTSKLCVIGLCAGNSSVTGEYPTQMASNAQNVFISWRHHVGGQETAVIQQSITEGLSALGSAVMKAANQYEVNPIIDLPGNICKLFPQLVQDMAGIQRSKLIELIRSGELHYKYLYQV